MSNETFKAYESDWLVTLPNGSKRPLSMADVANAFRCSGSPQEVVAKLVSVGLSQPQATTAVQIFREHNTMATGGVWEGVTARQRTLAMLDAANSIYLGNSPSQTTAALIADGYSEAQAADAVSTHLTKRGQQQKSEAPKVMLVGLAVTAIGVLATLASMTTGKTYHKVYIGAIVIGIVMMGVGLLRRLR